ncbi:MAG: AbrB family transcriptional regulator [Peptococcaceae bacterium]
MIVNFYFGWDQASAWLGSSPGRMQDMVIVADSLGAERTKVVAAHIARTFSVVFLTPVVLMIQNRFLKVQKNFSNKKVRQKNEEELMMTRALNFLEIPTRSVKPRTQGLTIVRDHNIGWHAAVDMVESVGSVIDYVKMRHITVCVTPLEENNLTIRKMKLYRENDMEVFPGGIVFENAYIQNKVEQTFEILLKMGFTAVECSENIIDINLENKIKAVKMAKKAGLKVLFEVGDKYPEGPLDVDMCVKECQALIDAGADLVIVEKSLLETSLGKAGEHSDTYRIKELVERVGLQYLTFEAESKLHQGWLFNTFGPDVNIGPNLHPDEIAKMDATRLTWSREGGYTWMIEKAKAAGCLG